MLFKQTQPSDISTRIVLTNKIALVLFFIASPYIAIFYRISPQVGMMVIPTTLAFLVVIALNYYRFYQLSRCVLVVTANVAVFYFASVIGREAGIQQLYFAFIGMPIVLFESKERWMTMGSIALPFLCQIGLEVTNYQWFGSLNTPLGYQRIIDLTAIFAVMIIIVLYLRFAIQQLEKSSTDLKISLSQLQESRDIQSHMAKQVGYVELVRNISHEFKNPIAMMYTRCEMVKEQLDNQDMVEKFASMMLRNLKRLDALIKPMLDYGIARETLSPTLVSSVDLLTDVYELSHSRCDSFGITLSVDIHTHFTMWCDRDTLFQAIINLISNSIQFTEPGGRIDIRLDRTVYVDPLDIQRDGIKIEVEDTGKGIPSELLPRVFDPYFTTKAGAKNAGLGLSIVFRIVTENRGLIRVESMVNKGTRFEIILPESSDIGKV